MKKAKPSTEIQAMPKLTRQTPGPAAEGAHSHMLMGPDLSHQRCFAESGNIPRSYPVCWIGSSSRKKKGDTPKWLLPVRRATLHKRVTRVIRFNEFWEQVTFSALAASVLAAILLAFT